MEYGTTFVFFSRWPRSAATPAAGLARVDGVRHHLRLLLEVAEVRRHARRRACSGRWSTAPPSSSSRGGRGPPPRPPPGLLGSMEYGTTFVFFSRWPRSAATPAA